MKFIFLELRREWANELYPSRRPYPPTTSRMDIWFRDPFPDFLKMTFKSYVTSTSFKFDQIFDPFETFFWNIHKRRKLLGRTFLPRNM